MAVEDDLVESELLVRSTPRFPGLDERLLLLAFLTFDIGSVDPCDDCDDEDKKRRSPVVGRGIEPDEAVDVLLLVIRLRTLV